jgi:hypothetical protein
MPWMHAVDDILKPAMMERRLEHKQGSACEADSDLAQPGTKLWRRAGERGQPPRGQPLNDAPPGHSGLALLLVRIETAATLLCVTARGQQGRGLSSIEVFHPPVTQCAE